MMFHAEIICTDITLDNLCHIVIKNSALLHNRTPRYDSSTTEAEKEGLSPMEIFAGSTEPWNDDLIHPSSLSRV